MTKQTTTSPQHAPSKASRDATPPVPKTLPIKDSNPPEAEVANPAAEIPKVGSRDAPGG
jgi:hypothetical protein